METKPKGLYAFSGLLYSGKDYVAKAANLRVLGFADPIYEIVKYYTGTADKTVPGIRKMMQQIGQWGRGLVNDSYPWTTERAAITEQIRSIGGQMSLPYGWVNWRNYGKRDSFWADILLTRLGLLELNVCCIAVPPALIKITATNVAVTNARFDSELAPLLEAGFEHWHVRCSEATREARMREAGYIPRGTELQDTSEAMAHKLDVTMPDARVIWNDSAPMPGGKAYVTFGHFMDRRDAENSRQFCTEIQAEPWTVAKSEALELPKFVDILKDKSEKI